MNKKMFKNPPLARRAKPFWSLNGDLKEEELKRQIGVLSQMGFGGAYLHARTGLKTEYLSDEWMRLMNVCADELSAHGMEAWLYDEDRYPSGVAGGLVTKDPALRGKYLTVRFEEDRYSPQEGDVAAFSVQFEGDRLLSYRPYRGQKGRIAVFSVHLRENQDVYNGYAYVDTLKREATEEFLRVTHERYAASMGEKFGGSVKGIFTDEPNHGAVFNGFAHEGRDTERRVPYTETLFEEYFARWGERLEDKLPELYFRGEELFSRTAWRYNETIFSLFLENYCKPYAAWCSEHGLQFTGHILHEDNLSAMTTLCGSPMRFYEHMDVPGVDNLTAESTNLAVPLMAASVARQCKKRGVMCEMYAAIGWQADFGTYKRIGDWHAMFGVNERCTHLSMYTMAGNAKRDYPASILHQADWWKDYSLVEDYFSRLNYFLSQGKRRPQLLYIHPVESAWGLGRMGGYRDAFTPTDGEYLALEGRYRRVVDSLAEAGVPFDFGDEEMMSRLARVTSRGGARLHVGAESYPCVLLAGNLTLRASTVKLLRKFLALGGKVYVVGGFPRFRDGDRCDVRALLAGAVEVSEEELPAMFSLPFRTSGGCAYTHYAEEGKNAYFVAINAERVRKNFLFTLEGERAAEKFDARTGKTAPFAASYADGKTVIEVSLDGGEELLLSLREGRGEKAERTNRPVTAVSLPSEVSYRHLCPNVCVFDFAEYALAGGQGRGEILVVDRELRARLGLPQRTPEAIQPWYRRKFCPPLGVSEPVKLRFSFRARSVPAQARLVYEPIAGEEMALNGVPLPIQEALPSAWDSCFRELPLPLNALKKGENTIEVSFRMEEETDVEAMYLLGDFGVSVKGHEVTLTRLPKKLRFGDITEQGFPFYGGELVYKIPLPAGRYEVEIPSFAGALVRIGKVKLPFAPFRAAVSGSFEVGVTVTRKNTFGPLHFKTAECYGSYGDFCPPKELFREDYSLLQQGLLEKPIVTKTEERI